MDVSKTHNDIFIDFDEHHSIERNFKDAFESGYVALHPFYKSVFQDDFDYRGRLKDTFHLIESVTWDRVINEIKFKNINQLAHALLEINSSDYRELNDFVEYKRLIFPVIAEDTIPEVLLHKYLKYLIGQGINDVVKGYSKHTIFERQRTKIDVNEKNLFDVIGQLQQSFVVAADKIDITLLLPDHDCPYTLILGNKRLINSFTTDFSIEGFWTGNRTKFDWWT